jgi:predicted HicB family RNase H-like nuclease
MKNIFITERDHFKWSKQKEYISHLETIDDNVKTKAVKALDFLEQELGAKFLKATSSNHPVRQMISNKASYQIKDLIEFTEALQILKKEGNNYRRLIEKLISKNDAQIEGISLVNLSRIFIKEGLIISFIDEIKNTKTPDVKITNPINNDTFYVEITKLNDSDYQKEIKDNYNFFHKQFNDIQPLFSFYGKQFQTIDKEEYSEISEIIADTKKRVKENNQIIYYSDSRFNFLLAPPSHDKVFNEICERNNIRSIHFDGLPIDVDETSRINNKIDKAYQIPENENGLLFISISPIYFFTTDLFAAIERLEANIARHKNLLGIVLFSKIVAPTEEKSIEMGNHLFTIRTIENLCYMSLFVYNNNCDVFISDKTIKKIYKSLT